MIVYTGPEVAKFVGDRVGSEVYPPYTCMGLGDENGIYAGVVFNCYTGADIHFTAAGSRWTRQFLREVWQYVFVQMKCLRMTAVTRQPEVVRLAQRLGGEIEGRLRNHFGHGEDGIILGILKEDYLYGLHS